MIADNLGRRDRIARAAAGTALLVCSVRRISRSSHRVLPTLAALTGATLITTATLGFCPVYKLLGLDTSR